MGREVERHRHTNRPTTNDHDLMALHPVLRCDPFIRVEAKGGFVSDIYHCSFPSCSAITPTRRASHRNTQSPITVNPAENVERIQFIDRRPIAP